MGPVELLGEVISVVRLVRSFWMGVFLLEEVDLFLVWYVFHVGKLGGYAVFVDPVGL